MSHLQPKTYSAYGLTIQSELELPLPAGATTSSPDISIVLGRLDEPEQLYRTYDGVSYAFLCNSLYLKWGRIGSYLVEDGSRIVVSSHESNDATTYPPILPLLGTVMAIALFQRGTIPLHGSCMKMGAQAVLFVGEKGEGKSTLAGYLMDRGYHLLSDDICAIEVKNGGVPQVHASFPAIKLWPDAMEYLNYRPDHHERVMPAFEKRNVRLTSGFLTSACDVAAIVVLQTSPELELKRLSGHEAFSLVLPHVLVNRYDKGQPVTIRKQAFNQVAALGKTVPIYQLSRPRDLGRLPQCGEVLQQAFLQG